MEKLAADRKLMTCLAAIFVATAMLGVASNTILTRVNKTLESAVHSTARKLWLAADINIAAGDMLAAQREILLYANTREAAEDIRIFGSRSAQVDRDAAQFKTLSVSTEELKLIGGVKDGNASYRQVVEQMEQLRVYDLANRRDVAEAYKDVDRASNQLEILESRSLEDTLTDTRRTVRDGRVVMGLGGALGLCVVLFALRAVRTIGLALRAAAQRARDSEAFLESMLNDVPCVIGIFDLEGNVKRWNKNFLGYSWPEMRETGVLAVAEPDSLEPAKLALAQTMETGYSELELYLRARDGRRIPVYASHRRFVFEGKTCILGVAIEISKQKTAEQFGRLQRVALEAASEAIVITDATGDIQWANPAFTTLTGYELAEVLGINPRILKSGMMDQEFYRVLWRTILRGEKWSGEVWNLNKDGDLYSEEMHIAPVRAADGSISNFVAVKHDITERKQLEAQAERAKQGLVSLNKELREANENILKISQTDPLTGLANRRTMDERVRTEMARAERLGSGFSVILGDLDKFKSINDEFGHLIGDHVLVAAAAVLAGQARPYDLPARFGGEEFMVILPENTLVDAMSYAQRVRCAIGELKVPGMARQITMSLGISTWEHGDTAAGLIGRADAALYQAKSRGRNRVVAQAGDGLAALESEVPAAHTQDSLAHFI